jgi:hypothetical protein
MNKQRIFYATFFGFGTFVAENWKAGLTSTDPRAVQWPANAYAFTIHQRDDVTVDGKVYRGEAEQVGPMYYHPDSVIEDLEQVKANPLAGQILIDNMRINHWPQIIWTRWGNWPQPFDAERMEVLS